MCYNGVFMHHIQHSTCFINASRLLLLKCWNIPLMKTLNFCPHFVIVNPVFPLFSHPLMSSRLSTPASASQQLRQRTWSWFFTSPWGRSLTYVLWLRCTRMTMIAISCCYTTDWPAIYKSGGNLQLDSDHLCLDCKQKRILKESFLLLDQHA